MILFRILNLIVLLCCSAHEIFYNLREEAGQANSSIGVEYNLLGEAGQAYSLEIFVGTPRQKLNVIVDTGSTTLAVASYPRRNNDTYFHTDESSSFDLSPYDNELSATYSQGTWMGRLADDIIFIPSLPFIPEVRAKFAIIEKSHDFFMNGSVWQGLMGLAYFPVAADIVGKYGLVGSWLDFVEYQERKRFSFEFKLCGADINLNNATHYGSLIVSDDPMAFEEKNKLIKRNSYRTPVLRKLWYEVGVLGIHILKANYDASAKDKSIVTFPIEYPDPEQCRALNAAKSIIDSGTTNIRLPDAIYKEVIDKMQYETKSAGKDIPEEFWTDGEGACFNEHQDWRPMPWIAIDLLDAHNDSSFFTVLLPPENYMRVVTAYVSHDDLTGSQFCYKLGIESGGKDTVLGYTAMEGLSVLFNRSAGWVSIKSGNCGPNAHVIGPFTTSFPIRSTCNLIKTPDTPILIKLAQWVLLVMTLIAAVVLLYLLSPFLMFIFWKHRPPNHYASSQVSLVEQEQM